MGDQYYTGLDFPEQTCPCGNDCPVWEGRGGSLQLCEISTQHLANAYNYLRRKRAEAGGYWPGGEHAQLEAQRVEDEMDNLEEAMHVELEQRRSR